MSGQHNRICERQGRPCLYKDFSVMVDKFVCLHGANCVHKPHSSGIDVMKEFIDSISEVERKLLKEYLDKKWATKPVKGAIIWPPVQYDKG